MCQVRISSSLLQVQRGEISLPRPGTLSLSSLFSLSLLSCLPSDHLRALISADFYPRKTGGAQVLHSFSTAAGQAAGASNATVVWDLERIREMSSQSGLSTQPHSPSPLLPQVSPRVFTSRRWFLLCALTCTDARGSALTLTSTPTQLHSSCWCWISPPTRDITQLLWLGVLQYLFFFCCGYCISPNPPVSHSVFWRRHTIKS